MQVTRAGVRKVKLRDPRSLKASVPGHSMSKAQGTCRGIIRRLALGLSLATLAGLAGCTWIMPGMNVRVGRTGQHRYEASGAQKSPVAGKMLSYRVIPITPKVVTSLLTHQDPSDAAPAGAPPLKPLVPSMVPPDYRIGPGDLINITVWNHPELNAPAGFTTPNAVFNGELVAADGTIYYPYVGTFKAAGMTVNELRKYLAEHLKRVIQKPQVGVRVVRYDSKRVEITGEVARPGTIVLGNIPEGILQAIDSAGGLRGDASRRRAILVRHGVRYTIDLAGLLSGNRLVPNPQLEPGDIIHIPDASADEIYMLGAVAKQQPLAMTQHSMTLIQALTEAGGLDNTRASGSGVLVFRLAAHTSSKNEANVYTIDMSTPQGVLLASQFPLRPRDVVYVQATGFAQYNSVINQLLPTITSVFELYQLTK